MLNIKHMYEFPFNFVLFHKAKTCWR